jgi:hypothetical protein
MSQHPSQDATDANVCDDSADLWQQAERLCMAVAARDLAAVPLYILIQSEMTVELGTAHHYAFTTPRADLMFRDQIDPWLGRGPCIVVNDVGLVEDFDPIDFPYVSLNCVLHELAHILDRPTLYAKDPGDTPERMQFDRLVAIDVLSRPPRAELPAYFGHESSFIRIAIHLAHRATLAGFDTKPAGIFHGHRHGLSSAACYEEALADEPQSMASLAICEIKTIPLPVAFRKLWQADIDRYPKLYSPQKGVTT